jgi:hypothetical protein
MSQHPTTPAHEKFYQILAQTMKSEPFASMPAEELLAITANFLGKLCAMQDQRRYTSPMVMEIVFKNLEAGNREMVAELKNAPTGAAN